MLCRRLRSRLEQNTTRDDHYGQWLRKPVFILTLTADEIAKENAVDVGELRDAQTDAEEPETGWLVVVGVCTHLDAQFVDCKA